MRSGQGVNNMFLVKSNSTLASLYEMDPGCLEKHHRQDSPSPSQRKRGLLDQSGLKI